MDINTGKALSKKDSLEQSIRLILLTPKGERILKRNFGSNVVSYLSQPINNIFMEIGGEVTRSLEGEDKRISVDSVSIQNQNDGGLTLLIDYNAGEQITLQNFNVTNMAINSMLMSEARKNVLT